MPISAINTLLAWLTVGGQIFLAIGIVYWLLFRKEQNNPMLNRLGKNGMALAWLIAAFATGFSLFYSDIAGFAPCALCWYQRIFMYPQVVLLGMAWLKKDFRIADYGLPLSTIGALVALYHNYISYGGRSLFSCAASALGASCTQRFVFEMGYITIPLISLTAFLLMIFFLGLQKRYNGVQKKS